MRPVRLDKIAICAYVYEILLESFSKIVDEGCLGLVILEENKVLYSDAVALVKSSLHGSGAYRHVSGRRGFRQSGRSFCGLARMTSGPGVRVLLTGERKITSLVIALGKSMQHYFSHYRRKIRGQRITKIRAAFDLDECAPQISRRLDIDIIISNCSSFTSKDS